MNMFFFAINPFVPQTFKSPYNIFKIMDEKKKGRKMGEANDDVEKDQSSSPNVPVADSTANLGPSNPY